jgi:hypothetical protein
MFFREGQDRVARKTFGSAQESDERSISSGFLKNEDFGPGCSHTSSYLSSWGDDRMVGALADLGHTVSDQTVGNILRQPWQVPTSSP